MATTLPFNKRKIRLHTWVASAVLTILWSSCAFAQMDTAMLVGRVADSSGAAIWRAQVELIDIERNTRNRVQTNATGLYIFPNTKPGHYRLNVSAPGYKTVVLTSLTIYVQDDIQQNFSMAAGSPLESVTLATNGTPMETTGTVGTVVEQTLVTELPLNGRSFQTLFQLTPGVVITPASFSSQGQFSVNGQRTNTNYFIIDGVSANVAIAAGVNPGQSAGGSLPAVTAFGGTNSLVSTDAVQEFAVLTSSYSPEFGRMPGGQISIVTKSGTNEFHGELFDYVRNDAFDANDWFANRDNLKRAALRQNDYGGIFGGPVLKDRTFFFISYEGLQLRQPTLRASDVPSLATRSSASSSMKPFFNAYPLPNGPDEGNGLARATYAFSDPSGLDSVSLRVSYSAGEKVSAFVRYDHSTSDRQQRAAAINSLSTVTNTLFGLQTVTAGISYRSSPTFINNLRFNWSVSSASGRDYLDSFGGAIPLSTKQVFPPLFNEGNGLFQFAPAIDAQNRQLSLGRNINNAQGQINVVANASYQIKSHILKYGVDHRRLSPKVAPASYTQQSFFSDIQSALVGTTAFTAVASNETVRSTFVNYSVFALDAWKPTDHLSVQGGMRWDYDPTPAGQADNGSHPFAVSNSDDLSAFSLASPNTPIYHATSNNFAPRLGVAYQVSDSPGAELVVHGGAGLFYDLGNGPAGNAFDGTHFPFSAQKFLFAAAFPLSAVDAAAPSIGVAPPFGTIVAFPSKLKLPYTWQWNVELQQSLGLKQGVTVGFVGASGHSLLRTEQYLGGVNIPPAFTQVLFTNNTGYSKYDALQLRFQRKASAGLRFIASYVLSHSLDNVSTDAIFNAIPSRFVSRRTDYGPSDFDIRHSATVGLNYLSTTSQNSWLPHSILANWSFAPIVMFRSAPPVDVVLMRDIGGGTYAFRPDLVAGSPLYLDDSTKPGQRRLNIDALSVPLTDRQGDLGRNSFRGFQLFQMDLAVQRRFRMKERISFQIRGEAFNLLNHPNFASPLGQLGRVDATGRFVPQNGFGISSALLGQGLQGGSPGTGFSTTYQIGEARTLQLQLKFEF